ncbi:hypothetical protein CIPAW_13G098400 [Carya illinoinensis]|uniref:Uncharacterized protein n=1 Tax=Carya illinoinensis TaxID=32201 RepID=A0A8T1NPS5_CARIL|nr:hypothetical protein CIPAW_13G098400 [Carya illinoinensis]
MSPEAYREGKGQSFYFGGGSVRRGSRLTTRERGSFGAGLGITCGGTHGGYGRRCMVGTRKPWRQRHHPRVRRMLVGWRSEVATLCDGGCAECATVKTGVGWWQNRAKWVEKPMQFVCEECSIFDKEE